MLKCMCYYSSYTRCVWKYIVQLSWHINCTYILFSYENSTSIQAVYLELYKTVVNIQSFFQVSKSWSWHVVGYFLSWYYLICDQMKAEKFCHFAPKKMKMSINYAQLMKNITQCGHQNLGPNLSPQFWTWGVYWMRM